MKIISDLSFFLFSLTFGICDLVFAYSSDTCASIKTKPFSLSVWLQVDGWILMASVALHIGLWIRLAASGCKTGEEAPKDVPHLMKAVSWTYIFGLAFRFSWMLVGATIFFGQLVPPKLCGHKFEGVAGYLWVYLIMEASGYLILAMKGYWQVLVETVLDQAGISKEVLQQAQQQLVELRAEIDKQKKRATEQLRIANDSAETDRSVPLVVKENSNL